VLQFIDTVTYPHRCSCLQLSSQAVILTPLRRGKNLLPCQRPLPRPRSFAFPAFAGTGAQDDRIGGLPTKLVTIEVCRSYL